MPSSTVRAVATRVERRAVSLAERALAARRRRLDPPQRQGPDGQPAPDPAAALQGPLHYDPETDHLWRQVHECTMTNIERINALRCSTRYLVQYGIPGAFVECGVWRGGSMMAAALTLQRAGDTSRELYLFDTFEGMPPPGEHDRRFEGTPAAEILAASLREEGTATWMRAGIEDVQANLASTGYEPSRVHLVKGMVEDTITASAPAQIALLRLDTDWYESTRHELEVLYPRLSPGGVLILDDYGHWDGARRAVDEWLAETGEPLLMHHTDHDCRIAVKPGLQGH